MFVTWGLLADLISRHRLLLADCCARHLRENARSSSCPRLLRLEFVYSRMFDIENHTLVEKFAVFPGIHPIIGGPTFDRSRCSWVFPICPLSVSWHTFGMVLMRSPVLAFHSGCIGRLLLTRVIAYSLAVGAICRAIDIAFLSQNKSVTCIAVLTATSIGVLTLLTTALNIALLSGGLLLAPLLVGAVMLASRRLKHAA
jgi:hypothetical protein